MKFVNISKQIPALMDPQPYRGGVIGDLFNTGKLDIVATVLNGDARILRNVSDNTNHWIKFHLIGKKSNRMAIGAQLKVTADDGTKQYDIVSTSSGYQASRDHRAHFGLGSSKMVKELEITWPGGHKQILNNLAANKIHKIEEA